MTTEKIEKEQPEIKKAKGITFKCSICGKSKPISKMKFLTIFHPTIVTCPDCEKKWW